MYLFEAWGASETAQKHPDGPAFPGLGGYSSGILKVNEPLLTIYLYIGSQALFNSIKESIGEAYIGGGSSDIRLYSNPSFDWFDPLSLRSRILVSGGGGGSEWAGSQGGHGGGLEGGASNRDAKGGTQTRGGIACHDFIGYNCTEGLFGMASYVSNSYDFGGMGGNGYYSGASIDYAGAGGGGSSFISGYEGCIALNSDADNSPNPNNSSIHYSGKYFINPIMIQGNNPMPLYASDSYGIGNLGRGVIRITVLSYYLCTNQRSYIFELNLVKLSLVFIEL